MRSGTASTLPRWSSRLGLPCAPLSDSGLADRQRAGLGLLTEQALALFALTRPHGRIHRLLGHDAGAPSNCLLHRGSPWVWLAQSVDWRHRPHGRRHASLDRGLTRLMEAGAAFDATTGAFSPRSFGLRGFSSMVCPYRCRLCELVTSP